MAAQKKKVLIATADSELRNFITESVQSMIPEVLVFQANDGNEATLKIMNDTPHIVLIDPLISKLTGIQLVEWIIKEKPDAKIAIILLSKIPAREQFVDQVATGQIQFLENPKIEQSLKEFLVRASEFSNPKHKSDLKIRKIQKDEVLIKQGDQAESVFLVRKGRLVAFTGQGPQAKELGHVEPGEFVGEMAYINGEPRSANVKAIEECELIEIPVHLLDHVLFTKPAWAKALMKTLSKRVKAANTK